MPKKKDPEPTLKTPRLIRRGDIVTVKGTQQKEVVRDVSIVLHLANGQDVVFHTSEEVEVHPYDGDLDPDEMLEAAQMDADDRAEMAQRVPRPPTGRKEA